MPAFRVRRTSPAALLIRAVFDRDARRTRAEMVRHTTTSDRVLTRTSLPYDPTGGGEASFDVCAPASGDSPLPAVVWIHGGAWISGDKADVLPYLQELARSGIVAIGLNYPISPKHTYPTALIRLNDALAHLSSQATAYRIDATRMILAGDSAGANLVSQLAVVTTNPQYAEWVGIEPALQAEQLRGVILNCGIYDVSHIQQLTGIGGWGFNLALRSYLGRRDWPGTAGATQMSTLGHVTNSFPATFISGGNGDPLTTRQSGPLAQKLSHLGVDVTALLYPDTHEPKLPHEYQFHLDLGDAQQALAATIAWIHRVSDSPAG